MFYAGLKALLQSEKLQFLGVCTPRAVYMTDQGQLEPWVWSFYNHEAKFFVVEFSGSSGSEGTYLDSFFITEVSVINLDKYECSEICLRTLLQDSKGKVCYEIEVSAFEVVIIKEHDFDTLPEHYLPSYGLFQEPRDETQFLFKGGFDEN